MSTESPGEEDASDMDIEPRAWIANSLMGDVKPVLKSEIKGLDEWADT